MGILDSFLHPGDPYKKAEQASQEGWQEARGYEQPYWQQGQDQYGRLNDATGALLDPAKLESQWASGYQQSPYAQQELAQNKSAGMDAASSMGLNGSSAALGNIQTGAGNIVNEDRRNYMSDLMQKYMQGIGLGSRIYGTGASAGNTLASGAMQNGENQANLQYARNQAPMDQWGRLAGMGIDLGMNYASGGMTGAASAAGNMFSRPANQYNSGAST